MKMCDTAIRTTATELVLRSKQHCCYTALLRVRTAVELPVVAQHGRYGIICYIPCHHTCTRTHDHDC